MRADVWWKAERGKVHALLLDYVKAVESDQSDYFVDFMRYEALYDPNGPAAKAADPAYRKRLGSIKENVIARSVDTGRATIGATEVRARFMTKGADWSTQRRAVLLEKYAEEIGKLTDIGGACRAAFFACEKKGTGLVKVYADQDGQVQVEPMQVDNVIVDDCECANGARPRQLHYRQVDCDRDMLTQQFPDSETEIDRAQTSNGGWFRAVSGRSAGRSRNDVLAIESWRLPMGKRPDGWNEMSAAKRRASRYVPGRHVITIEGRDLLDEEYHKHCFPIAEIRWSERDGSWYGIGLAERMVGHQKMLDKLNLQGDRQLDLAVPTAYVSIADRNLTVQTTAAGNIVAIKGAPPVTVLPTVVGPEVTDRRREVKASALAEVGLNAMSTTGTKPPGIESGAGVREVRDMGSQLFSMQEKALEKLWLGVVTLVLDVCKDLGDRAPEMSRQTKFGPKKLPWADVEIDDVRVQIAAASTLARTPAGLTQTALELSQAGAITMDELRRLLKHPDLEGEMSLWTSALEAIEFDLEAIEEGHAVIPDPFTNLIMAQDRGTKRINLISRAGAPEEIVEGMRAYVVQAADLESRAQAATPALPAGMPMDPMMVLPPGGDQLALPPGPPMAMPQQMPSAGPPTLIAAGPAAA